MFGEDASTTLSGNALQISQVQKNTCEHIRLVDASTVIIYGISSFFTKVQEVAMQRNFTVRPNNFIIH